MDIPHIHAVNTMLGYLDRGELTHAVVLWAQCVEAMGETRAQALVRDYVSQFADSPSETLRKVARTMQDITGVDLPGYF